MVILAPVGVVPGEVLDWLPARVERIVRHPVAVGEPIAVPEDGWDTARRQHRGDALLLALRRQPCGGAARVVGLIDADCYAPGLRFVFGEAQVGGREAFVALARLRQSFYGLADHPLRFHGRILKEVVHELGHTWGLRHCPRPRCVMHFSSTLEDTDAKGPHFCPHCRSRLA